MGHATRMGGMKEDRQCTYNVILRRVRVITVAVVKTSIAYSEFPSVSLVMQHAKRMRRIMSWLVWLYYVSSLSHKRHDFWK